MASSGLNDLFEVNHSGMAPVGNVAPKAVWLPAVKTKGLGISETFTHHQGHMFMEMHFPSEALQHMTLCYQLNKNGFGVIPSTPRAKNSPLTSNQSTDVSLPLKSLDPVMNMEL